MHLTSPDGSHPDRKVQQRAALPHSRLCSTSVVSVRVDAGEERFQEEAPGNRVIHLATHGCLLRGGCLPDVQGSLTDTDLPGVGARTAVGPLWPISDEATVEMMSRLYTKRHENIPEAVRRMQLEKIEEARRSGQSDHPFTWGAFIGLGDRR